MKVPNLTNDADKEEELTVGAIPINLLGLGQHANRDPNLVFMSKTITALAGGAELVIYSYQIVIHTWPPAVSLCLSHVLPKLFRVWHITRHLQPSEHLGVHLCHFQLEGLGDLAPSGHQGLHLLDCGGPVKDEEEALLGEGWGKPLHSFLHSRALLEFLLLLELPNSGTRQKP